MRPVEFPEQNMVLAKDQPEYLPLPVHRTDAGQVISCWQLGWWERVRLFWSGRLWLRQLTFGGLSQPLLPQVNYPFEKELS